MAFKMKMKGSYGKGMPMKSPVKLKEDSPMDHATDAWGFKHGKKFHRSTLADQVTPAPGHEKGEKMKRD